MARGLAFRISRSEQKESGGEGRGTLFHRGPPHQDLAKRAEENHMSERAIRFSLVRSLM